MQITYTNKKQTLSGNISINTTCPKVWKKLESRLKKFEWELVN